jgi:hypothetical protein
MLSRITDDLWHVPHQFKANGLTACTRMTIVRLNNGSLWLHSPVPLDQKTADAVRELGTVRYIVAPSKMHHLFVKDCLAVFPDAKVYGVPGLPEKRPDLVGMQVLGPAAESEWQDDMDQLLFAGIPFGNETVWFHRSSKTLILTDLCQWWQGNLPFAARLYAQLTGVRKQFAVPHTVRWLVKDRAAARASAAKILQWPFERVIVAHHVILERQAHATVRTAFACFDR